jgi:hypothetical protein
MALRKMHTKDTTKYDFSNSWFGKLFLSNIKNQPLSTAFSGVYPSTDPSSQEILEPSSVIPVGITAEGSLGAVAAPNPNPVAGVVGAGTGILPQALERLPEVEAAALPPIPQAVIPQPVVAPQPVIPQPVVLPQPAIPQANYEVQNAPVPVNLPKPHNPWFKNWFKQSFETKVDQLPFVDKGGIQEFSPKTLDPQAARQAEHAFEVRNHENCCNVQ